MQQFKFALLAGTVSVLIGCGGSGGGSNDTSADNAAPAPGEGENETVYEDTNGNMQDLDFAEGKFTKTAESQQIVKSSVIDQSSNDLFGSNAAACAHSELTFESENFIIYGSTDFREEDYKALGHQLEQTLPGIEKETGISTNEWMSERRNIAKWAIDLYADNYAELPSVKDNRPDNFSELSENEQYAIAWTTYIEASSGEREELIIEAGDVQGYELTKADFAYDKKLYVCMHENTDSYAESNFNGINIVAPSVELSDTIPSDIMSALYGSFMTSMSHTVHAEIFPRWFELGFKADLLAGEKPALTIHPNYDPTMFVKAADEEGYELDNLLPHYQLAVRYLTHRTELEEFTKLYQAMAADPTVYTLGDLPEGYDFEYGETGSKEATAFIKAFDAVDIEDYFYLPLTLNEYKYDYHDLIEERIAAEN